MIKKTMEPVRDSEVKQENANKRSSVLSGPDWLLQQVARDF